MTAKKEEEPLKPSIVAVGNPKEDSSTDPIGKEEDDIIVKVGDDDKGSDSFFKKIVDHLFSSKNLGAKTEYTTLKESFAASKLEYMGKYCNMPYALAFLRSFETKRISFGRKGRQELVKSLEKRNEEIEFQNRQSMINRTNGPGGMLNG